jgi:hypothetical protein
VADFSALPGISAPSNIIISFQLEKIPQVTIDYFSLLQIFSCFKTGSTISFSIFNLYSLLFSTILFAGAEFQMRQLLSRKSNQKMSDQEHRYSKNAASSDLNDLSSSRISLLHPIRRVEGKVSPRLEDEETSTDFKLPET